MVRMLIAIVAGVVLALASVSGFDMLSHALYPPPPGVDFKDPATLAAYMTTLPFGAKAIVAAGWLAAPFLGALAAIWIAREDFPGWVVAAFFLAAATANVIMIPHPKWMVVACFVLPGIAAMLAQFALSGRVKHS
jgi:hypothetical protein